MLCLCGCGQETRQGSHFIRGHNLRLAKSVAESAIAESRGFGHRISSEELKAEFGVHGTPIWYGLIREDFNAKFADLREAIRVYDEMRRTDSTIQAVLLSLELPILQARWFVTPASSDPLDQAIATIVQWNLFHGMTTSFQDLLRQAMSMHWAGFSVFEKVFEEKRINDLIILGWRKFAHRLPQTIARWELDESGGPRGVWQQPPDSSLVFIPIEKLLIFTNRKEGGNLQGLSFLRAIYRDWYYKDRLLRLQAIGLERDATGIPVIKLPSGSSEKDKGKAREIVTKLRRDEEGGIVIPESWILELLNTGRTGGKEDAFQDAIRLHDQAIARGLLAQVINLGDSGKGSYALGVTMADLLTLAQEAQADLIASCISDHAVRQLVRLNFPTVDKFPRLKHGDVRRKDARHFALIITSLAAAGILEITPELKSFVANFFGLPTKDSTDTPKLEEAIAPLTRLVRDSSLSSLFGSDQMTTDSEPSLNPSLSPSIATSKTMDNGSEESITRRLTLDDARWLAQALQNVEPSHGG